MRLKLLRNAEIRSIIVKLLEIIQLVKNIACIDSILASLCRAQVLTKKLISASSSDSRKQKNCSLYLMLVVVRFPCAQGKNCRTMWMRNLNLFLLT